MSSRTRSDFGTLCQRVRAGAGSSRRSLPCHVWVDGDQPGVLCEWRTEGGQWWGRCLHLVDGHGAESWIRADRIQPVGD